MTIGTLVAFTALQAGLFRPVTGLLNVGVSLVSSLALFARIFEYLDLPVEVDDPAHPVDVDPARVRGHVRIEDVTFGYPGSDTAAVAGVTLDVPAGSTLALVGETGSGKSTLAALVARLHDPDAGRITIDGIDLRDLRLADLARDRRRRQPGDLPAAHHRPGEPAPRPARRHGRRDRGRPPGPRRSTT